METQTTIKKQVPKRNRNLILTVRATQDEKDFIMKKVSRSGLRTFNRYALKMLITGEVKNVDLTHYRELAKEVNLIGKNINQIVKFCNSTGRIFESEIGELQRRLEDIWQLLRYSLSEQR